MLYVFIVVIALGGIVYLLARRLPELLPGGRQRSSSSPEVSLPAENEPEKSISPLMIEHSTDEAEVDRAAVLPKRPGAEFIEKADRLFSEKRFRSAERWYLEAAAVDPRNPKIYSRLGVIYLQTQSHNDAKEAFEAAIEIEPGKASRHFNLAVAYEGLGDLRQALKAVKKAISLEPENPKYQALEKSLKSKLG